mmetsp:Transcript_26250/g.66823  ORF Transcript_26250/g.66823 Transcript_26250/m.66823 type:complete len:283 (-) Transcript_26250:511-1359(-)
MRARHAATPSAVVNRTLTTPCGWSLNTRTLSTGPHLAHSAEISPSSSSASLCSATSPAANMLRRMTVDFSAVSLSSNPPHVSSFSCFCSIIFLSFLLMALALGSYLSPFISNLATVTVMLVVLSARKGAPSSSWQASGTDGSRRYVTSASPLSEPVALSLYSLMRGCRCSSSLISPYLENTVTTSSTVTSSGRPVTYTLVLFFSSNHSAGLAGAAGCPFCFLFLRPAGPAGAAAGAPSAAPASASDDGPPASVALRLRSSAAAPSSPATAALSEGMTSSSPV